MKEALFELNRVHADLRTGDCELDDLWHQRLPLWRTLGWEPAQLRLWLHCQPGIQIQGAESDNPRFRLAPAGRRGEAASPGTDDGVATEQPLGDRIADILATHGKPAPPALIRSQLPSTLLVTDAMIRAAARDHPRLSFTGPLIRLRSQA